MAVPSSGVLSLLGVKRELSNNNYSASNSHSNISLKECSDGTVATINTGNASSDRPDGNAPHSISEFYAYDHDVATITSFSWSGVGAEEAEDACGQVRLGDTAYHNGSGTYPVAGDVVYTNSAGTAAAGTGAYKMLSGLVAVVGSNGVVDEIFDEC